MWGLEGIWEIGNIRNLVKVQVSWRDGARYPRTVEYTRVLWCVRLLNSSVSRWTSESI